MRKIIYNLLSINLKNFKLQDTNKIYKYFDAEKYVCL